jgi:hypothetical protein
VKKQADALQNVMEGIAALSSLALVAERVIERVVASRSAKSPKSEEATPIAGDDPETTRPEPPAPKRRGRPRAKPRATLEGAEGGLVCRARVAGEEVRFVWTWAELAAAIGPERAVPLAEELARVCAAKTS